jgi:hypothetical protein
MDTELTVRDAPGLWPGARVYRVACRHGASSAVLIPGPRALADGVVLDLVLPGHQRRFGCACVPAPPFQMPMAVSAC